MNRSADFNMRKAKRKADYEQRMAESLNKKRRGPLSEFDLRCFCGFNASGDGAVYRARKHADEFGHGVDVYPELAPGIEVIVPEVPLRVRARVRS